MKSLMLLWIRVAEESAARCCTSATRDINYVTRRVKHEGLSFLTITLPTFGKDTEKCLDLGYADHNLYQGFPWQAGLPRFLGGFLDLVFDRASGVLVEKPNIDAILAIRQLTLMNQKIALESSDARRRKAMKGYLDCEREVRYADSMVTDQQWSEFRRVSHMLFAKAFTTVDDNVLDGSGVLPKHGPGATADKLRGNAKYQQKTWPTRLQVYFPREDYLIPNDQYYDRLDMVTSLEPEAEIPVKVISVPKTLKTPRIIGVEPTAMQYTQQAVAGEILDALKEDDSLRAMIGFRDQPVNQAMAQQGSRKGNLATLDLSEASDRVSNQHVRNLFADYTHLHGAVDACRSRKAVVPGGDGNDIVIRLAKFASMGSALCFPVEAMVFLTMIFIGIEKELNTSLSPEMIKSFRGQVRVYGDDIIVPVRFVQSVIQSLESFGIRVNMGKSFWNGKFRESCGKEYYDGHDISIVRVRQVFPTKRTQTTEVQSIVSLRNQLYWAGYWQTVRWLDSEIEKVIKYFPVVLPTSPVLGRESALGFETQKIHATLHSPLVKGYVVRADPPPDNLDGVGALLKCLLLMERRDRLGLTPEEIRGEVPDDFLKLHQPMPTVGKDHLKFAGRPRAANIKLGYGSAI